MRKGVNSVHVCQLWGQYFQHVEPRPIPQCCGIGEVRTATKWEIRPGGGSL